MNVTSRRSFVSALTGVAAALFALPRVALARARPPRFTGGKTMRLVVPPMLWYETDRGEKWVPPANYCGDPPTPPGFVYQHSRFPRDLHHRVLGLRPDGGCEPVFVGISTWWEDATLAMAASGDYRLSEAILVLGVACERCMNAIAHHYGVPGGYPESSLEYRESPTRCEFCEHEDRAAVYAIAAASRAP